DLARKAHAHDLMRGKGSRTQSKLLPAAENERPQTDRRIAAHVQRADALRPVALVRRERKQVDAHRLHIDPHFAHALRCIDVKQDAALATDAADSADILDDADLI